MKTKRISWYLTGLMVLSIAALARSIEPNRPIADVQPPLRPTESANPILVDNRPVNFQLFSTASRGLLTVISANPASEKGSRIQFRVYVKRNGETVANDAHPESQPVTEIDLNDVLTVARPGDWLIIEPVRKEDMVTRHTLLLTSPMYQWMLFPSKEGC